MALRIRTPGPPSECFFQVTFLMMPLEIAWNTTVSWRAGDAVCRIMSFFRTFGLYLSSFVIVSISLDR
jgi:gonadotropin-releasing hormone receptor